VACLPRSLPELAIPTQDAFWCRRLLDVPLRHPSPADMPRRKRRREMVEMANTMTLDEVVQGIPAKPFSELGDGSENLNSNFIRDLARFQSQGS
jgi:hypothetical protein